MSVRKILFITACVCVSFSAHAENSAGYGLLADAAADESFPKIHAVSEGHPPAALWDEDPSSSGWIFRIGGEFVSPSDSDWVREDRGTESGRILSYSNKVYSFEQRVFISAEKTHAKVVMKFFNNSTDAVEIVPMLLLDTVLGETTGLPFLLSGGTYLKEETLLAGSDIPDWIKTVRDSSTPVLTISFADKISDTPDSLIAANWLRLKQSGMSLRPQRGRNFDYLPFSEADSALLIGYGSKKINSGDSMEITVVFGLDENVPRPEEFNRAVNAALDAGRENTRLREYAVRQRLREIESTISAIDSLLADEGMINADNVIDIEKKTGQQERLRAEYENL